MKAVFVDEGGQTGSSLLEVLMALSLLATSILGIVAVQLSALRNAGEQVHREQASWIAASAAEAMRLPEGSMNTFVREKTRAAAVLPGGQLSVVHEANGTGAIVVAWAPGQQAMQPGPAQGLSVCSMTDGVARGHCAALPFASRR